MPQTYNNRCEIWHAAADKSALPHQISLWVVHIIAPVAKTSVMKFLNLGTPVLIVLCWSWPNLACKSGPMEYCTSVPHQISLQSVCIVAPMRPRTTFSTEFSPITAKFGVDPQHKLPCQISSQLVYCRPWMAKTPNFIAFTMLIFCGGAT